MRWELPRNNLQITEHGAAGIINETETTSLSLLLLAGT